MDEEVISVLEVILLTRHADIPFLEVVALVLVGDQHPKSDVELSLADKQGSLDILLNHEDVRLHVRHGGLVALFLLLHRGVGILASSGRLSSSTALRLNFKSVLGEVLELL